MATGPTAILLAAGVGKRLRPVHDAPKCLLRFGGRSLLARMVDALAAVGVAGIEICTGYRAELLERELEGIAADVPIDLVHNPRYTEGSVVSLWCLREALRRPAGSLVLDADVLFDPRILRRLVASENANCMLIDREFEPGEEPVKVCIRDDAVVEFRKQVDPALAYDYCGESVGFFRFDAQVGAALAARCEHYEETGRGDAPHEEAIRDVVLADPGRVGFEDVTGLAWTEIDFEQDLLVAADSVLPRIDAGATA